jgi:hypothetical protein
MRGFVSLEVGPFSKSFVAVSLSGANIVLHVPISVLIGKKYARDQAHLHMRRLDCRGI